MTREEAIRHLNTYSTTNGSGQTSQAQHEEAKRMGIKALEQKPATDYKAFTEWVAGEIFSEEWGFNKDAFAELACRKLSEMGIVKADGDKWVLESEDKE